MANRKKEVDAAVADLDFDANTYQVEFKTTLGSFKLNLDPSVAPGHCRNMIGLTRIGFYDGLIFHRIIPGFMIQGGCPEGSGTGGPGYQIKQEFNATPHVAGVLSMARSGDPNSAGSQFFVCLGKHTHLDRSYTAFGKTADDASLDVVKTLGSVSCGANDRPHEDVRIESATVIETPIG
ncbi:MAG: peptidylprolyl isomerase [Planctomycetota bacterium]|nr:peptidylprolyl isomerase [Planctomycetota bacterium]